MTELPASYDAMVLEVAGALRFGAAQIPSARVMTRNIRLVGVTVGSVADHRAVSAAIAQAGIVPHISHELSWGELPEAMRVLQAGERSGKIALALPS